jgi:hypothetical protein
MWTEGGMPMLRCKFWGSSQIKRIIRTACAARLKEILKIAGGDSKKQTNLPISIPPTQKVAVADGKSTLMSHAVVLPQPSDSTCTGKYLQLEARTRAETQLFNE